MPHPDMNANGGHPDEGLLHEWLDDQLSPTDAAEMQTHISGCVACGMRVAEARGLIAASRRILSALDDVPSGVIPTIVTASNDTDSIIAHSPTHNVVSIDVARKATRPAAKERAFSWQRAASIAAVLVVAVTVARVSTSNFQKVVPAGTVASEARPLASSAQAAPAAPAPLSDARSGVTDPSVGESASLRRAAPSNAKPEQVASAKISARDNAPESGKPMSKAVVADAAVIAAASPADANSASRGSASPVSAPPASAAVSLPPPIMADQVTARADATTRVAAAGGRGGGGGGGRGRVAAELPPNVASVAAAGNAGSSGMVGNTPPVGAAMANLPPASAPLVGAPLASLPAPPRDSTPRRAEFETAQRAVAQSKGVAARADSTDARTTLLIRGSGNNRLAGTAAGAATVAGGAVFDSVTLIRTECSPACETTSLHVNALGAVRYVIRVGQTQRVATSQLSLAQRAQLQALVLQSFPNSLQQRGRMVCSSLPAASERKTFRDTGPEVQLLVDLPRTATTQSEQPCAKSATELRDIGVRVDAIAGTDAIRRRMSSKE